MTRKYRRNIATIEKRHLRYLFFVDSNWSTQLLLELMYKLMEYWGGRYNPIIPVYDGVVNENYERILNCFDPDYIYYTSGLNLDKYKKYFNTIKYWKLDENSIRDIKGVDSKFLLDFEEGASLLYETGYLYKTKIKDELPFYKLNFGFNINTYLSHPEIIKYEKKWITDDNLDKINEVLSGWDVHYNSLLSQREINNTILNPSDRENTKYKELIISQSENQFGDLVYFWNRQLFIEENSRHLNQIYITNKQLIKLSNDKAFHELLGSISGAQDMVVKSVSINEEALSELIEDYLHGEHWCTRFKVKKVEFPYECESYGPSSNYRAIEYDNYELDEGYGVLPLKRPSFVTKRDIPGEQWVVSVEFEEYVPISEKKKYIRLPIRLVNEKLICPDVGRIDKDFNLNIIVDENKRAFNVRIPSGEELIKSLLSEYRINSEIIITSIDTINESAAGQTLKSFIKIFDGNFELIKEYISERFWIKLFKSESEFIGSSRKKERRSNLPQTKGIFSLKDLEKEYRLICEEQGITLNDKIVKNINIYIQEKLQYLVDNHGLYIGLKVKCNNCGSRIWYSLKELDSVLKCKGCNSEIVPQVNSSLYYKISDVIINNLLADISKNNKDYNGNYVVLNTLAYLKEQSHESFSYCPSLEYISKMYNSDIDILAIQDGKLIIGEAKNDATEINNSEIQKLSWLGKELKPNRIIIAFNKGQVNEEKIEKLKRMIDDDQISIEIFKVKEPEYRFFKEMS